MTTTYRPRREARSRFIRLRGLECHVLEWGEPETARIDARVPLVLLHGWMDVAASFQFVVDAIGDDRYIVAADWRGFGRTLVPAVDSFWFPDYLGDLDALVEVLVGTEPGTLAAVDLVGHSMGGNVAMMYAGVRPQRVRRLVNLEGFGMPDTRPAQAPGRYRRWLDELREPATLPSYASLADVAARLMKNNPRLAADKAAWLAPHWAEQRDDGRWHVRGDPAHKRTNPVLYRKEEALACWRLIEAPVLWVEGERTEVTKLWGNRYPRDEIDARLAVVPTLRKAVLPECGHMLHHDQPELVARQLTAFVDAA